MAVRNESVRLSLDDQFTSGMARAAAATALFKRELDGLDGKRISRDLDETAKGVDSLGTNSRKSGPDIDKLSGRLRLLTDAAVTLGPALIPLGAATIPVLTGAMAGLGAAAGGIGVTVLAMHGLGDALKALNDYQLEPTAENLQALRVEQEKLGPSGAHFLAYIDSLSPALHDLQMVARDGLFPGVEDGIDDLLQRLPQVKQIVSDLSQEMGNLARDAGVSIGGENFSKFFDYIETDAAPTLDAFARSAGNVALGLANMLAAFAPATRDFTGGLEDATKAFADWSDGLDNNKSFQEFVDYVLQAGPQAVEFLGALAQAVAALLEAAAPFGQVVLPALTAVLKVFAAIGSSDAGPALYAVAAGMLAFNRAAAVTTKYGPKLSATFAGLSKADLGQAAGGLGILALSMSDLDDKAGLTNTAMGAMAGLMVGGPWGAAVGAAIGAYQDLADATAEWTANIKLADDALRSGNTKQMSDELVDLDRKYQALLDNVPDDPIDFLGNLFNPRELQGNNEALKAYAGRISSLKIALKNNGDVGDLFAETIGRTGDELRAGTTAATEFSSALAGLNGWFDKRDAVRNYKDSIDELKKSLKDGFSREDAANVDALGRSILQVATQIKNPGKRATFLDNARNQLLDMAQHSGPKAAAALQEIVDKFDDKGLTAPKIEPTVDDSRAIPAAENIKNRVKGQFDIINDFKSSPRIEPDDTKAKAVVKQTTSSFARIDALRANPFVTVQAGDSLSLIDRIRNAIGSLHDRTVTVTVNQRGGVTSSAGGRSSDPAGSADGGTVPRSGRPYADRFHYMLADGEEVISNRHGQADRHRSLLKAINAGRLADGGTAGNPFHVAGASSDGLYHVEGAANGAAEGLKGLKRQLNASEKALDRERSKLESLTASRDSLASSATSSLLHDPFGKGLAGFDAQVGADAADSQAMLAALQTLVRNGLDPKGALFQALAASGDVNTAQQMAALTSEQLFAEQSSFNQANTAAGAVGQFAGNEAFGSLISDTQKAVNEFRQEVRHLRQAVNQMGDRVEKGAEKGSHQGTKEYHEARNRDVRQAVRAGTR